MYVCTDEFGCVNTGPAIQASLSHRRSRNACMGRQFTSEGSRCSKCTINIGYFPMYALMCLHLCRTPWKTSIAEGASSCLKSKFIYLYLSNRPLKPLKANTSQSAVAWHLACNYHMPGNSAIPPHSHAHSHAYTCTHTCVYTHTHTHTHL